MDFWHSHKLAILFTLRSWGAIVVSGTLFWAFINAFLTPDMPVDVILIVLLVAIIWSAPYVFVLGIIAMLLNKSDFELKEKKRVLTIVGIILGFVLIENVTGFSKAFLGSLGYLFAIPISIFNFKLESSNSY